MNCPECGSDYVNCRHRDLLDPACDHFECLACDHRFHRYDQTKYETPDEKVRRFHRADER